MEKYRQLLKIKEIYENGGNIISFLKSLDSSSQNTIQDILISYDFQSGSYVKDYLINPNHKNEYCKALAGIIEKLGCANSLLEVGVGEATTLRTLLNYLTTKPKNVFGFDISWSRLKFAKNFLADANFDNVKLFTANLFEIPLLDNSIDIVYTSHSIEPNGGKEEEALKELYRVTKNYLVLLEPSYEFANDEARLRMKHHGYVTQLYKTAKKLNYKIIEHRLFDLSVNPLNPTGLIIIEKNQIKANKPDLVCPISKTNLVKINDNMLYSNESYLAYPILENIPCLLKENSILAIHFQTNYEKFIANNKVN